jgi:hypothetical protein
MGEVSTVTYRHGNHPGSISSTSNGGGIGGVKYYDAHGGCLVVPRLKPLAVGIPAQPLRSPAFPASTGPNLRALGEAPVQGRRRPAGRSADDRGKSLSPRRSASGPMGVRAASGATKGNRRGRRVRPRRGKETGPGRTSRGGRGGASGGGGAAGKRPPLALSAAVRWGNSPPHSRPASYPGWTETLPQLSYRDGWRRRSCSSARECYVYAVAYSPLSA